MRRILSVLKNDEAYAMAYYTIILATVLLPLMSLTIDITRLMYVRTHLQTAADGACAAAAQAVFGPSFNLTGRAVPDARMADTYARREFEATVADQGIIEYAPRLDRVLVNGTFVELEASASVTPLMPVTPGLSARVLANCEARASGH